MNRYLNNAVRPISRNWLDTNTNGRKKSSVDFDANLIKAARSVQEEGMIKEGEPITLSVVLSVLGTLAFLAMGASSIYYAWKEGKFGEEQLKILKEQNRIASEMAKANLQMRADLQRGLMNKFLPAVPTAAIGASLGGLTGGLYTAMKPKEERTNKPVIAGTLLGGLAGLGYGMLQNKI